MKKSNLKSRSITIRFSSKSARQLMKEASRRGMTLSYYIRNRIASGSLSAGLSKSKKRSTSDLEKRNATISEIHRSISNLGNNLNQAVRAINARVVYGKSTNDGSLVSAVERTQKELKNVTDMISRIERRS